MPKNSNWEVNEFESLKEDEFAKSWYYKSENLTYSVFTRYFFCTWGSMKQVTIKKDSLKDNSKRNKEPTMCEKINILRELKLLKSNEVAIEVFPKKTKIVDEFDLYHLWILEKESFPYYTSNIKLLKYCIWKKTVIKDKKIWYIKKQIKLRDLKLQVYFIKAEDELELFWYEKQNFKDFIIGENVIGIEYISNYQNITTIVCIPEEIENLPFGLKKN